MANLDRIANVEILLGSKPLFQEGFNILLIAGPHVGSLNRVETITSADQLLDMGVSPKNHLYLAAVAAFSQIPRQRQVKIGRRQVDSVTIRPTVSDGATYKLTIRQRDTTNNAEAFSFEYIAEDGTTAEAICAGLKALTETEIALQQNISAAEGTLVITNKNLGAALSIGVSKMLTLDALEASDEITNDLNEINREDSDWYGLAITSRKQDEVLDAAEWTESKIKLFAVAIAEPGAADAAVTNDTGSKIQENNYFRTHWWYHPDAENDPVEAAVTNKCFRFYPGSETWANQQLGGIKSDNLTETQYLAVTKKGGNTFEPFRNYSITQNGKVAAGEWIDIIRFRDWLQEEITIRVFRTLVTNKKVNYTDPGIAKIETALRGALLLGQKREGIAPTEYDEDGNANPGFVVEVPLSTNISSNDKANRVLNDVYFNARPAGAIHAVNIIGSLSYDSLVGQGE